MTSKSARHRDILRLIRSSAIGTQDALGAALSREGFEVSQSTLSKDLSELGLSKIPGPDGTHRYQVPGEVSSQQGGHRLQMELAQFLMSWEAAGQMVVLKTITGHAPGVAWALDSAGWEEIVGTVAGEDTVFVVARTPGHAKAAIQKLEKIIGR